MPRGDRTGPRRLGAMTGRGAGFCAGNQVSGGGNPIRTQPGAEEQADGLKRQLDEVIRRLDVLERQK